MNRRHASVLVGGYMAEIRKAKGVSQAEMARKMKIGQPAISSFEIGRHSLKNPSQLKKFLEAYELTKEEESKVLDILANSNSFLGNEILAEDQTPAKILIFSKASELPVEDRQWIIKMLQTLERVESEE